MQERLGYSHQEAENIYFDINALKSEDVNGWISPWPVYNEPSPMTRCYNEHNITLRCDNFMINLSSHTVYLRTPSGIMYPKVAVFTENNTYIKKEYPDTIALLGNGRELGIIVLPDKNAILVSDYLLSDSMFTKLFFLDGYGIKDFRKFYEEQTVLGNKIIVWRIDWGNNLNDTKNYKN